ncbi:PREDICTED: little elongation complex subunit 2-like [Rhagoletis zephyria]|uniref:little elongation complex subunit 2-like n=1 Tax=Rhagoletis zephyria TaxID=28612 RepID=UPI000811308F|nr:PREDICTED: little elongation complex subunit 2-like [Rhagoletis zephyria]
MNKDGNKFARGSFFYNQPPYTHFNKSFDEPGDALYHHLNEVHPVFMQSEHLNQCPDYRVLLDPRTKTEVKQIFYDHTIDEWQSIEIFRSLQTSIIKRLDHLACLRVIKAWQEFSEVDDRDVFRWRSLERERASEKEAFDKILIEYSRTQKEAIYAPTDRFVTLYKRFYAAKLNQLLLEYPENLPLNTHAGIPHPRFNKSGQRKSMQIENVGLLRRKGWVPVKHECANDFQRLNLQLERCMDYYINSITTVSDAMWETNRKSQQLAHQFHIPLESLVFLLTAGNSPDLPTEVHLQIEKGIDNLKIIKFKEPLPPRICGWYTHKLIVENAFEALVSTSEGSQWLYIDNDIIQQKKAVDPPEIQAAIDPKREFHAYEFGEYLEKKCKSREKRTKNNFALVEWNLNGKDQDENNINLQLLTSLKLAPAMDISGAQLLSSYSVKLEYKPQFGAEQLTQYELIKEWLRIKLLGQCSGFTDRALCFRVAVKNLSLQLEHSLMLASIELQLSEGYQLKMPHLIAGLTDTLQLLVNMPIGQYFLRYNPKYPERLLLSAPSKEITPNTVFLHTLLKVEPSDLAFMTDVRHLPISDSLCTVVHERFKIMPCAFKPRYSHQNSYRRQPNTFRMPTSDEEYIRRRLAVKKKKKDDLLRLKKSQRRLVKATKVKRRKKLEKQEAAKDNELEKFINEF